MEKYLEKAFNVERTIFDESIYLLRNIDRGINTGYEDKGINWYYESAYISGAFGAYIKYQEEMIKHHILLNRIDAYAASLKSIHLTDFEYTKAFLTCIENNIKSGILKETPEIKMLQRAKRSTPQEIQLILNTTSNPGYYFEPFVESYFTKMFSYPDINTIKENELFLLITSPIENIQLFIEVHNIIKKHYLDKKDTYTNEDITIIIEYLTKLGLDIESLTRIKKGLEIIIYKNNKKEKQNQEIQLPKIKQPTKEYLSKKEYFKIKHELEEYIDLCILSPVKELTLKEIIYCIRLLMLIDIPEYQIDKFLKEVSKTIKGNNPISLYISLYDKINYYAKDETIKNKIKLVEEYLKEIFICQDDDYRFWKDMIEEELSSIIEQIPNTGEYEKQEARRIK